MSLLIDKNPITIINVQNLRWGQSSVSVSPRPYHALSYRVNGSAIFSNGASRIVSTPGTVAYIPANVSYHADYSDMNELYVIHFESDNANFDLENYSVLTSASILSLFQKAFKTWNEGKESYYFKVMSIYYEILAQIAPLADNFYSSASYKSFLIALDYMRNNFKDRNLSVGGMADMAKMSERYFRKLFAERVGETPCKYLTLLRLQHAENLLMSGKYSIEEIAFLSGFNDAKYFSRVVKKIYGCPPSELYRKKEI